MSRGESFPKVGKARQSRAQEITTTGKAGKKKEGRVPKDNFDGKTRGNLEAANLSLRTGWEPLSSSVQTVGKRNYEEEIDSRRIAEQASKNIITTILESVSSQHDCGYSTACPSCHYEMICERNELFNYRDLLTQ